jgi:hypothetical protein
MHAADPAYATASDAAFEALRRHVELCQRAGWRPEADIRILTNAAWALAHGVTVLRAQGSLAKHLPDTSLDGVAMLAATLIGSTVD